MTFTCPNCGADLPQSAICSHCSGGKTVEVPRSPERIPSAWPSTSKPPSSTSGAPDTSGD
jgi:hypothetical protein